MKPHWKSALSAVCRVAVKHHIYKVVLFLCLSLSVQIPILFRCFHHWNLCNYSKGHRSTLVSRHNLRHWGSISISGTPQPYLPFLKRGIWDGEARNTHAASAVANSSEKCSCLGRTAMDFCSNSSTEGLILLVRFWKKKYVLCRKLFQNNAAICELGKRKSQQM